MRGFSQLQAAMATQSPYYTPVIGELDGPADPIMIDRALASFATFGYTYFDNIDAVLAKVGGSWAESYRARGPLGITDFQTKLVGLQFDKLTSPAALLSTTIHELTHILTDLAAPTLKELKCGLLVHEIMAYSTQSIVSEEIGIPSGVGLCVYGLRRYGIRRGDLEVLQIPIEKMAQRVLGLLA